MATLKIEEGQIESETKQIIAQAVKRGIEIDSGIKNKIKYKVIENKMHQNFE